MGNTHTDTLDTIMNIGMVYKKTGNFTKAEELYMLALDRYEKLLGKDHEDTKDCARNLALLVVGGLMKDKVNTRELVREYLYLMIASASVAALQR